MSTDTPYAHSINTTESLSNSRQCKIELIIPKLEPVSKLKQFKGGISEHAEELVIKLTYTHVHVHVCTPHVTYKFSIWVLFAPRDLCTEYGIINT